ncbi:hypothetical protein CVT25_011677 [Psilocybe cyanescens]|uniref:Uncharacterized protein n=1 Tax=Psilocybe cyanescens TaxID=93625 RepID=A0A409XWJ0_PSICY|nr:hypothetical protein CVT25_011677 [Psilocybe cyanescens]
MESLVGCVLKQAPDATNLAGATSTTSVSGAASTMYPTIKQYRRHFRNLTITIPKAHGEIPYIDQEVLKRLGYTQEAGVVCDIQYDKI